MKNVKGFDGSILTEFLGDVFEIVCVHADTSNSGFPFVIRHRVYHVLVRKRIARICRDMQALYAAVTADIRNAVGHIPINALFFATDITQRTHNITPNRRKFLRTYEKMWLQQVGTRAQEDPRAIFDLNQNPEFGGPTWTAHRDGRFMLPCLTTSSLMWIPSLGRFLEPVELAAAMGFPVLPAFVESSRFDANLLIDECVKHRNAVGNAMRVASVGIVAAVALSSVQLVQNIS